MAKDLRGLLEPAPSNIGGKNPHNSAPLAQRRALSSPGEPRVFRVRSGFVCGLCGRLHNALEPAFDCLGRCTIELRLRSPAGPNHSGNQPHFACSACGRGFVNSDDAEQCFEKCLHRMKPTPQFEQALRRVQVRYAQRLASHGVRNLERIDPLSEHSKMLAVLTQEQAALGRPGQPQSQPKHEVSTGSAQSHEVVHSQAPAPQSVAATEEASLSLHELSEENLLEAAVPLNTAETAPSQDIQAADVPAAGPIEQSGSPSAMPALEAAPAPEGEADSSLSNPSGEFQSAFDQSANPTETAQLDLSESNAEAGVADEPAALTSIESAPEAADMTMMSPTAELSAVDELSALDNAISETPQTQQSLSDVSHVEEGFSALTALVEATPESINPAPTTPSIGGSLEQTTDKNSDSGLSEALSMLSGDSFGESLTDTSEFASLDDEPKVQESMGADVLALLQAPPEGENLQLDSKQERLLKDKALKIDTAFLDDPLAQEQLLDATKVHVRNNEMKPYRRNNAKYCCSACAKEFFTKEQVEACFFSHPEEGSEEARLLLEKAEKLKNKSAA